VAYCDFIWVIFLCSGLASLFFHLSSIFEVHGAGCTICTPRAHAPPTGIGVGQIVTFFAYRPPTP